MPHSKSAKKRNRQAETRRDANREKRSSLRTLIKKARSAASSSEGPEAFKAAAKALDRASQKHLMHPNRAARTKSRLHKLLGAK